MAYRIAPTARTLHELEGHFLWPPYVIGGHYIFAL